MQDTPVEFTDALNFTQASSDVLIVRILLLTAMAGLAAAQSHPSWWTYASPDSTALVGIHWENLRQSPFAPAIEAELSSTGSLGFPNMDCLWQAREMVLSSPPLLAAEAGRFPAATVQREATAAGLKRVDYFGVAMWLPAQAAALGVAQISDTLVLVGTRKTLEAAVHQSLLETGRRYSPLLMRGARYSQTGDLWVVSVKLPDPLASLFVPLDADARSFEGAVSLRNGLSLEASFDTGSDEEAAEVAAGLRQEAPTFPGVARGMRAVAEANRVTIVLEVTGEQLNAELRAPQAARAAAGTASARPDAARPAVETGNAARAAAAVPAPARVATGVPTPVPGPAPERVATTVTAPVPVPVATHRH
jgi:hypothetical protein